MLEALQSGKNVSEAMAPMIKRVMEAALEGEMAASSRNLTFTSQEGLN